MLASIEWPIEDHPSQQRKILGCGEEAGINPVSLGCFIPENMAPSN